MPYRKRKYRRASRRYSGRRKYPRKRRSTAAYALRLAKRNNSLLKGELKWAESLQQVEEFSTSPTEVHLLGTVNNGQGIPQGDGQHDRIGDTVQLVRMDVRGTIQIEHEGQYLNGIMARIMIMGTEQECILQPTPPPAYTSAWMQNALTETHSVVGGTVNEIDSSYRMDPPVPWRKYYDRKYELAQYNRNTGGSVAAPSAMNPGTTRQIYRFRKTFSWPSGLKLNYLRPTAEIPFNQYFVLAAVCNIDPTLTFKGQLMYSVRLRWHG